MRMHFGPFVIDGETRLLTRDGGEVRLTPKAFDLLLILAADRPKVLSKQVLLQRLWPDTFVEEANLSNLVAEIRSALDDRPRAPRYIRTAHGVGYAFLADTSAAGAPMEQTQPVCWLQWGRRRFPLAIGTHVVGRDPDVQIRLDASTISRRHARVIVNAAGAVLEDFGSKNGTFRGDDRVTVPIPLTDGDAIRLGSLLVTFHVRSALQSTETQTGSR